jgi:ribosome-associated protein
MAGLEPLRVDARLTLPAEDLRVDFARSGGPGGQNVNKVETKVILAFHLEASRVLSAEQRARLREKLAGRITARGEVLVQSERHRSRERNLTDAREKLARLLSAALSRPKTRRPTRPTAGSGRRRLEGKRQRAQIKRSRRSTEE